MAVPYLRLPSDLFYSVRVIPESATPPRPLFTDKPSLAYGIVPHDEAYNARRTRCIHSTFHAQRPDRRKTLRELPSRKSQEPVGKMSLLRNQQSLRSLHGAWDICVSPKLAEILMHSRPAETRYPYYPVTLLHVCLRRWAAFRSADALSFKRRAGSFIATWRQYIILTQWAPSTSLVTWTLIYSIVGVLVDVGAW
jgi:hypothetical protein